LKEKCVHSIGLLVELLICLFFFAGDLPMTSVLSEFQIETSVQNERMFTRFFFEQITRALLNHSRITIGPNRFQETQSEAI